MDSCDKVIIYKIDKLDENNDKFGSRDVVNRLKTQILNSRKYYSVIGLFGAYGEGKTTIINTLREELKIEKFGMLDIDVWKYDIKDIQISLYKIYNMEKDMKSVSGNIKQTTIMTSRTLTRQIGIKGTENYGKQKLW